MIRRAFPGALLLVAAAGCGHSVEPRAPYHTANGVPIPGAAFARFDVTRGIVLTWSATPAERVIVDAWHIERRTSGEASFPDGDRAVVRDTTFVDGFLEDGVRYVYRVRAVTAAGVAGLPAETAPLRADLVAPSAPSSVMAITSPDGITLNFTPGPEGDVAFFEARLVPSAPGEPPLFRQFLASPAELGGLPAGAEYTIEVAAIDSAGRSSPPSAPPVIAVVGP